MAWFSHFNFLIFSLTKNSAEVQAATLAIKVAAKEGIKKLLINSQNQQLVNSASWIPGWKVGWFAQVFSFTVLSLRRRAGSLPREIR